MEQSLRDYRAWVAVHNMSWMGTDQMDIGVEETFDAYFVSPPGAAPEAKPSLVESFFRYDAEPLTGTDVERALKLLEWSRQDLFDTLKGLSVEKLDLTYPGERWSINGILKHIGGAEWWYQERMGLPFPRREDDLSEDPLERLELVRAHLTSVLPKLESVSQILDKDGEIWSPRKMLRRAVWHERDHTDHIRKLL